MYIHVHTCIYMVTSLRVVAEAPKLADQANDNMPCYVCIIHICMYIYIYICICIYIYI